MKITQSLLVLSVLAVVTIQARSDSIPGLFNTGVISQTPLILNTEGNIDPHYTLVQSPDLTFPGPASYVVITTGGFFCCWIPNGPDSQWISARPDTWIPNSSVSPGGQYDYQIAFDLTGFNPSTASITGQWATDNNGGPILLNGVSTGLTTGFTDFSFWTPFTISSGFVAGLNTLDFPVSNGCCSPTGLRVEFLSSTVTPVPEPSSLLLLGSGAFGLLGVAWRKVRS